MANLCERCKHAMSAHDNHASCPQCRVAAGECSVDPKNPCTTCEGWTRKQWARLRRSLIDARARAVQRGKQHWITAFPNVEAWILAKPVSTSASEISSQAGEGDFDDETLVDTPKQHEVQVLVVQTQNGANTATSSTTTAAGTTITAQSTAASTAAFQVAGPSTKEPIVEQLGQDTPSVIQGARPEQSTALSRTFPASNIPHPLRLPSRILRYPSRTMRMPSRTLRLPSRTLHLITICLLCQLGLLSQWDILARAGSYLLC